MITIYSITNTINNKRYIGKSKNTLSRWAGHKSYFKKETCPPDCNRYLYASVKKHGVINFKFEIIELFDVFDEVVLRDQELYWMLFYKTTDRDFGYNLRLDSSTGCATSNDTRKLQSIAQSGVRNGNHGHYWSKEQKDSMSDIAKERHARGDIYNEEWRSKISEKSTQTWSDLDKRAALSATVKIARRKYIFDQFTRDGEFIRTWESVDDIVLHNPTYKWQNIYSVCNGYKPTYMNYVWKKRDK
jgi:group I intron endonuclease